MPKFYVLPLIHSILVLIWKKKNSFFGLQSENYTTKWLSFHCQIGLHLQFAFQFAKNWWFLSRNFKCICFPACMHTTYKQQQNFIQFATFLGGIIPSIRDGVLRSGMLLYLHHRNSKLFFHPAKFDNFKDEKISDYKTVSLAQSKNLLEWKLSGLTNYEQLLWAVFFMFLA